MVPLISWAQGYLGSRDKGKDTVDVNKMPYQGVSLGSAFFIHFVLFSAGCEKVKSHLAGLDSRIPKFWILFCSKWGATEGLLPQSNAVLVFAERTLYDEVFVFSRTVFHSCTGA